MIDGVRQRVYRIKSEILSDPYRLATLEAIEKKMKWWMAQENHQINWNEQPLSQPNSPPPHTASCPLHTTPPIYKVQGSGVQPEIQVQQAFNLEEWMTPECLEDIAQFLEIVARSDSMTTLIWRFIRQWGNGWKQSF